MYGQSKEDKLEILKDRIKRFKEINQNDHYKYSNRVEVLNNKIAKMEEEVLLLGSNE